MTDTTTTDPDELAAAEHDLSVAEDHLADVQRRITDDDPPTATAVDLIRAETVVEERRTVLARVRDLGAQRRERAAERQRAERAARLEGFIADRYGGGAADLVAAFDRAQATLVELVSLVQRHNDGLDQVRSELLALVPFPGDRLRMQGELGVRVVGDDVTIRPLDPEQLVAEAAGRALHAAGERWGKVGKVGELADGGHTADTIRASLDLAPGALIGESDHLRRTARIVAERGDQ